MAAWLRDVGELVLQSGSAVPFSKMQESSGPDLAWGQEPGAGKDGGMPGQMQARQRCLQETDDTRLADSAQHGMSQTARIP